MWLRNRQHGFTLIEMVMVITILGVVTGMVAVFMKSPVDAYFASARRAGLTDVADTTMRRMARDIRKSLPNSLRTPSSDCVEFIPTKTGGRYRTQDVVPGDGKSLDFTIADTTFHMLGSNLALPVGQQIVAGDLIVVYNLGIAGADAYNNDNTAVTTGPGAETAAPIETPLGLNPGKKFPLASGSNRFHVVPVGEQVVSYVCDAAGTGRLLRTTSTLANAATTSCTTTGTLAVGSTRSVLATKVTSCNFNYTGSDLQRNALIRMTLQITDSDETVSLQHEVHVNNTP